MFIIESYRNDKIVGKFLRKKIIWAEIKAKEQEYGRICKQIYELEEAKKDISFQVQKIIQESQEISDWIDEISNDSLMKYEETKNDSDGKKD